jgi:hypothetical protein
VTAHKVIIYKSSTLVRSASLWVHAAIWPLRQVGKNTIEFFLKTIKLFLSSTFLSTSTALVAKSAGCSAFTGARAAMAVSLLLAAKVGFAAPLERADFGRDAYPIWSPLSFFERQTIAGRFAAQDGDPDALLALFTVASGRYDLKDYARMRAQTEVFITSLKKQTDGLLDPWQHGELLNTAMHYAFFQDHGIEKGTDETHRDSSAPPSNYDLDQSALAGIFDNRKFNCISSSLLYAVLARRLGLNGRGVMLPSHAFIQLEFDDGKEAEVETTSIFGYDKHHDPEFYQRAADAWFNPRGLAPSTYGDYLNRELIPFWQLGTRNMLHQHTHPKRMNEVDRGRLAEISAFIDPSYEPAQINRIHYYTTEATNLAESQQWPELVRLFTTVMDQLALDVTSYSHNKALQDNFFWLRIKAIEAYAQTQQLDATLNAINLADDIAWDEDRSTHLKNASVEALNLFLKSYLKDNDFQNGLSVITSIEPYASDLPRYAQSIQWFYSQWAKFYWNTNTWSEAVAILEDYLAQPYLVEDLASTQENIAGAYQNWVREELTLKNRQGAKAVAVQCEVQHDADICKLAIAELNRTKQGAKKIFL